jgi:hypothetical protein
MIRFTCQRKTNREGITMNIALLGIDLAKNLFHLHAVDLSGKELFRKRLNRWELLSFIGNLVKLTLHYYYLNNVCLKKREST